MKENLFFPLSRSEIDEIGMGRTITKHYHRGFYHTETLFVLVGKKKHPKSKFQGALRAGISLTSIAVQNSDLETIEAGDSVSAEYDHFRVIILSDQSLERLNRERGR